MNIEQINTGLRVNVRGYNVINKTDTTGQNHTATTPYKPDETTCKDFV